MIPEQLKYKNAMTIRDLRHYYKNHLEFMKIAHRGGFFDLYSSLDEQRKQLQHAINQRTHGRLSPSKRETSARGPEMEMEETTRRNETRDYPF